MNFGSGALHIVAPLLWLVVLGACTPTATPYQPIQDGYGYEETRLQEKVYRLSFKANRYTEETRVLDFLYLRAAELTKSSGFTHFVIVQDYGKTQAAGQTRPRVSIGMGFASGMRSSFWGAVMSAPISETEPYVQYHLGVFVIRMLSEDEAKKETEAMEANYMEKSLREKFMTQGQPAN